MMICLRMGKNLTAKIPPGNFQVITPETLLLSQQAVPSKGIPSTLPTYSWTLTLIPYWTCSVATVPFSDARLPSTWLTVARILVRDFKHQLRRLSATKFFSLSTRWRLRRCLVTKPYGANTLQLLQEKRWTRARTSSPVTICLNRVCTILVQLANLLTWWFVYEWGKT